MVYTMPTAALSAGALPTHCRPRASQGVSRRRKKCHTCSPHNRQSLLGSLTGQLMSLEGRAEDRPQTWVRRSEHDETCNTLFPVCAVAFGVQVYRAAADDVPTDDVRKSCKTDTQAYQGPGTAPGSNTASACVADEQTARATLVSQWTQFAPDSRSRCMQMVGDPAGPQSYAAICPRAFRWRRTWRVCRNNSFG